MKKLFFIIVAVVALVSCNSNENKKHGYLVTSYYPSHLVSELSNSLRQVSDVDLKTEYIGEINDSIIQKRIANELKIYEKNKKRYLREYASAIPKPSKDYVEAKTSEIEAYAHQAVLRHYIGKKAYLIVISDSLLNTVNGDYQKLLKDYEKTYSEMFQVYDIYDGTELASELEVAYEEEVFKKRLF